MRYKVTKKRGKICRHTGICIYIYKQESGAMIFIKSLMQLFYVFLTSVPVYKPSATHISHVSSWSVTSEGIRKEHVWHQICPWKVFYDVVSCVSLFTQKILSSSHILYTNN